MLTWFKDKYGEIRYWFKCCFNKQHFYKSYKAFTSFPYDYGYLLDLEREHLQEMLNYFKKGHLATKETYDRITKYISIAIYCIDVMKDKVDTFRYNGELEFKEIDELDENGEKLYEIKSDNLDYECLVKVNTKNLHRFFPHITKSLEELVLKEPSRLYEAKAKHLYYKIRETMTEEWWD